MPPEAIEIIFGYQFHFSVVAFKCGAHFLKSLFAETGICIPRLQMENLKVKLNKCSFFQQQVNVVSADWGYELEAVPSQEVRFTPLPLLAQAYGKWKRTCRITVQ